MAGGNGAKALGLALDVHSRESLEQFLDQAWEAFDSATTTEDSERDDSMPRVNPPLEDLTPGSPIPAPLRDLPETAVPASLRQMTPSEEMQEVRFPPRAGRLLRFRVLGTHDDGVDPMVLGADGPAGGESYNAMAPVRVGPTTISEFGILERTEPSRPVEYVMGACFLMPRAAFEEIGGLDNSFFMYFEETDWCYRARQAGREIWFCAETEITHLEGKAAEKASRFTLEQFQKSYRIFVTKHYGKNAVWAFRLAQFVEYGFKWLLRRIAPGNRSSNLAMAANFAAKAKLQLRGRIDVTPPS